MQFVWKNNVPHYCILALCKELGVLDPCLSFRNISFFSLIFFLHSIARIDFLLLSRARNRSFNTYVPAVFVRAGNRDF